jgi:hypothetical protein
MIVTSLGSWAGAQTVLAASDPAASREPRRASPERR